MPSATTRPSDWSRLRARELVAANRLYRQSAAHTGDEVMGATLEDLERVLLEIANAPADLSAEDFAALRDANRAARPVVPGARRAIGDARTAEINRVIG